MNKTCSGVASGLTFVGGMLLLSLASGCQTTGNQSVSGNAGRFVVAGEASAKTKESFNKLKGLAGTWKMENPEKPGEWSDAITFSVTSGGNVVREIMFAGEQHEMTNTYHLDGDSIMVTHYCAMGNQPSMRASRSNIGGDTMHFAFDHVTNYASNGQPVMCDLSLKFDGQDSVTENWKSCVDGGLSDQHNVEIALKRSK